MHEVHPTEGEGMKDEFDEVFGGLAYPGKRPLRHTTAAHAVQPEIVWDAKPLHKMLHGQLTEFFSIGHLATALGRTPVTIRSWEDKGWLPLSRYRAPNPKGEQVPGKATKGKRLYTREQIEVVIAAANKHGVMTNMGRDADWKKFAHAVLAGWKTNA